MSEAIGGALIKEMTLTYSWGGTAASATVTAKGASSLGVGDNVALVIGALSFYGIVVSDPEETSDNEGALLKFSIVDNREKLKEDIVLCRFNKMIVVEDDPSQPGIHRTKKYEHIYPGGDWEAQTRTVTSKPHTAKEVLDKLFGAPTVTYSWDRIYHTAQNKACHEIDCNHGKKLLSAVLEVTESQGLTFTLVGDRQLIWGRKGEDAPPAPNTVTDYNRTSGYSLNTNDTRMTIVGDSNRYQELSIGLVEDWQRAWEAFWLEADWLAEVDARWGPFSDDDEGHARLAAKARSVTVRDYAGLAGAGFMDYGKMGDVARLEIPAWIYLTRVVWHAYRVPYDYTVNGVPLLNLTLVEEMLIAVDCDIDSGTIAYADPEQLYPDGYGFIVAQGQQIGLIDPRTQRSITPDQLASARSKWTKMNRYHIDKKNKVIYFDDAVFIPGEGSAGLFIFPNQGSGMDPTDPLYNLCVPNHNVEAEPANVKASLTWDAELFSMTFGSGRRAGAEFVSGLCFHSILDAGANVRQIDYDDGQGAEDKAADYAASKIANQTSYLLGGFDRKGTAGTALNTSIDRITATYGTNGINERIEFTKERGPSHFTAEDELARRQKERDRYPGERKLKQEVRDLKTIADLLAGAPRRQASTYQHAAEVMQRPVGCEHPATQLFKIPSDNEGAGSPIFFDATTGLPDDSGTIFVGVTIADGVSGHGTPVATQGIVPVSVTGPFKAGDPVGMDDSGTVMANGPRPFGVILGSYTGTQDVLVPVRLGAGTGAGAILPFTVVAAAAPSGHAGETGWVKVVLYSMLNGLDGKKVTITGLDSPFKLDFSESPLQYIWIKVDLSGLYADPVTAVVASIGNGKDWNGDAGSFWPSQVEFSTDDGTPTGSSHSAPTNRKQKSVFAVIAWTYNTDDNPWDPYDPPGLIVGQVSGDPPTPIKLLQVLASHLRLYTDCAGGDIASYLAPWSAPYYVAPSP